MPRRISSPCFLNNFSVSLAICVSTAGRKSGKASRMTTSEPNRCQTLPSSNPITPAPMIPSRSGTRSNASAPVESTISSSSIGQGGIRIGVDPGAKISASALSCTDSPLGCRTLTSVDEVTVARPETNSTLFALSSPKTPCVSCPTTSDLRCCIFLTSTLTLPTVIPNSEYSSCALAYLWDMSSNVFEGMQPTFKQVPPGRGVPPSSVHESMHTVFKPS